MKNPLQLDLEKMPKDNRIKLRRSLFIENEIHEKFAKPFMEFLDKLPKDITASSKAVKIAEYLLNADLTSLTRAQEAHNLLVEARQMVNTESKVVEDPRTDKVLAQLIKFYNGNNVTNFYTTTEAAVFQRPTRLNNLLREMAKIADPQAKPVIDAAIAKISTINRYMEI